MARSNLKSLLWGLRYDFVLVALLLVGWWIYDAIDEPTVRPTRSETMEGSRPPDRTEGDVLVLLPDTPAAEALNFDEIDCSYGWFNSLWAYYGSFASTLTRDLSPEILAGRTVVVVPSRVAQSMSNAGVRALTDFVRDGGQLILEQPGEQWAGLTELSTTGKMGRAQRITSIEGLAVHGPMREHLPNVPLTGTLMPSPPLEHYPDGPVLIEIDGQPGLTTSSHGAGRVYSLYFEFACTLVAMQQGLPRDGMTFKPSSETANVVERVRDEKLLEARVPYVDILRQALFHKLTDHRPIPRFWTYPSAYAGAFIVQHPTPDAVRPALGWAYAAHQRSAASTLLVASDRFSRTQRALAAESNAEVGLLWVRGIERAPVVDSSGLPGIGASSSELSLSAQFTRLNLTLPDDEPLRIAHVERGHFANDWSETFEALAAARLRVDTSLGPQGEGEFGYLFGSAYPFYPIDDRGLPLPLLELPFVLSGAGVSMSRLEDFFVNSKAYFHQPIVVSIPGNAMRTEPSADLLLAYRDGFDKARSHSHWTTTVGDFIDFVAARRRSVMTSRWDAEDRVLSISINVLGARARSLPDGAFPGVAIPRTWNGQEIEEVEMNGESVKLGELVTTGTSFERIISVGPGRKTVQVTYAAEPEPTTP